jgi:hypothetical protein
MILAHTNFPLSTLHDKNRRFRVENREQWQLLPTSIPKPQLHKPLLKNPMPPGFPKFQKNAPPDGHKFPENLGNLHSYELISIQPPSAEWSTRIFPNRFA